MINAVTTLLQRIHLTIPEEILDLAFGDTGGRRSIDDEIKSKIIEGVLVDDLSSVAGKFKQIVLDPRWCIWSSLAESPVATTIPYALYKVPPESREFRDIVAVQDVSLPYGSSSSIAMAGTATVMGCNYMGVSAGTYADQALNGVANTTNFMLPTPILMQGNIIRLEPAEMALLSAYSLILSCRLRYDPDFTNLTPDAVTQLTEIGVSATKAYIYNKMVVKLDVGATQSGQEIGRIREIIDSYAEEMERYKVLKEEFHGIGHVLDLDTLRNQMLLGIFI